MGTPLNAYNLRRFFLLLTRAHYSSVENHGYLSGDLGCAIYSDNPVERTVNVAPSYEYNPNRDGEMPSIYVGVDQPLTFSKLDLRSEAGHSSDNSAHSQAYIAKTAVNFVHIFKTADQALLAAESTLMFMIGIQGSIRSNLNLMSFEPVSMSPPAFKEKAPESQMRVDVTMSLSYQYNVLVNIESHRIKKFAIELQPQAG